MNFSVAGINLRDMFQMHTINLSVAVWVGFIALFGIATNDGVIMGTYIHQVFEDMKPATVHDVREAVVSAGLKRVRPAMMTTAAAVIALLPVLSSTGKGSDIMIPMAIPMAGGMVIPVMTVFVVILFSMLILCSWFVGNGQEQPDSLFNYLGIAAKSNPMVLQKFAEYQAALQKIPQVGGLPDPELNVGVFLSPMELLGGKQVADIRLMQMFPWFGVLKNAKDEMSLMAKAKYELFRDSKLQVFYDVQRTWYELYKVKQNIRILEKNIELLHTIERLAIVRFKAVPTGNGTALSTRIISPSSTLGSSSGSSGMNTMGGNGGNTPGAASNQASSSMPASSMGSS